VLKSFIRGLEYGLAGLLMSPLFLYRNESRVRIPATASTVVFNDHSWPRRLS